MTDFWDSVFSTPLWHVLLFAGSGVVLTGILLYLRHRLFKWLHKKAVSTTNKWDDAIVQAIKLPSLFWAIWFGIYLGIIIARIPDSWFWVKTDLSHSIFILLAVYTIIVFFWLFLDWFKERVTCKTHSNLDDTIIEVLKIGVPIILVFLAIIGILRINGIEVTPVNDWLADHGAAVTSIVVITVIALLAATALIPNAVCASINRVSEEENPEELKKREDTLTSVLTASAQIIILIGFVLTLLSQVGVNITAVLAGAGVIGIAVGFGAQSLVKDIIAGLFIITENQYRTGDVVKIADIGGLVEKINLRRTILRDLDGIVHVVPNGEIRVASNFTKKWSRVNLNISVSYNTDLDRAIEVINRVGQAMASDPKWQADLISPPKVLRVDNFGDSGIDLKILGDTKPIRQWDVMGELRLRLKREFDKEGIEIPWPHIKLYFGELPPQIKIEKQK